MSTPTSSPIVRLSHVSKAYGTVHAVDDISLDISGGEFIALLGPSGCGKTTTLRMLAGFVRPTAGEVWIDGVLVNGVPPERRPVNMVFQHYALFPHMSVAENVAYGPRIKGHSRNDTRAAVREALQLVRLEGYEHRRVSQLSGGQAQRVALARALVNRPAVLLLDEPLGALDLQLRRAMQLELRGLQQRLGITFVYVTHDQEEAMVMADRIVLMNQGRIVQVGSPQDLYHRPATVFASRFLGETNLLHGILVEAHGNRGVVRVGAARLAAALEDETGVGSEVAVSIRPERLTVRADDVAATIEDNHAWGTIRAATFLGSYVRYIVETPDLGPLIVDETVRDASGPAYQPGARVRVAWPPAAATVVTERTGDADGQAGRPA